MKKLVRKIKKNLYISYIESGMFYWSKHVRIIRHYSEYRRRKACVAALKNAPQYKPYALAKKGYVFVEPNSKLTSELVAQCREIGKRGESAVARPGKQFFTDLLKDEDYAADSILLRFALDEKLLNTVSQYIGSAPFLNSVEVTQSKPNPDGQLEKSQLWHTDAGDKRMIKVFVYIDPVEADNGPFTFLPADECRSMPPTQFLKKPYMDDDYIGQQLNLAKKVEVTGPAGTTLLVDTTNCYHFGSRCVKPRLVYIAHYVSGFSFHERYFPRHYFDWHKVPGIQKAQLSELQKYTLGLR